MSWLTVNGIDFTKYIAAIGDPVQGDRREIGDTAQSAVGFSRITRQSRKYDLTMRTVPLSGSDANVIEQFVCGIGQGWNFEGNPTRGLYSSKGLGPEAGYSASIVSSGGGATPRFDDCVLRLAASSGGATYHALPTMVGTSVPTWTFMIWRFEPVSTWHHYLVRSDGAKWKDGVRDDSIDTSAWLFTDNPGYINLLNTDGSPQDYDEMLIYPFVVLNEWVPAFAAGTARAFLPYVSLQGDLIRELPADLKRSALGTCTDVVFKSSTLGDDTRTLAITLKQA